MKAERSVRDKVSGVFDKRFCVVIHLVKPVKIFFYHDEVEGALEAELAKRTLKFVYLRKDSVLEVFVEFNAGGL